MSYEEKNFMVAILKRKLNTWLILREKLRDMTKTFIKPLNAD